jgi:hypothetical protein
MFSGTFITRRTRLRLNPGRVGVACWRPVHHQNSRGAGRVPPSRNG